MFSIKTIIFYIIYISLIPFNTRCNNIQLKHIDTSNRNKNIVLIFDHFPPYLRTASPFPKMTQRDKRSQVTIFDNFYQYTFDPAPLKSDTIIFAPQNNHIVLSLLYSMNLAPFDYILYQGDTITFTFVNNKPYASSKISDKNKRLNYEYERLIVNKKNLEHTPYDIFKNPILVAKDINDLVNNRQTIKRDYYIQSLSFLKNELSFLDSSKDLKENYPGIFNFFMDKYTYEIAELNFEQNKLDPDSLKKILAINKYRHINKAYSYFFPFLEMVSEKVIVKQARVLKSDNGTVIDYRDVYDQVRTWPEISNFYRKHLLYKYLRKIGSLFSSADLQKYLSDFSLLTNDSILIKKIHEEFPSSDNFSLGNKDSLYLLDANNNRISFEAFLTSCKGKVVYIDFWASWCVPCRREMKYASKLREAFKNQDVVFIYLSVDKSKNAWIEASNDEGLNTLTHNYIVTNTEKSSFLESIDFGLIPRYLLLDKYGKLVHKNASPPSSEEASRLITGYLSK